MIMLSFDLKQDSLIRAYLYTIAPDSQLLLLVVHHIVSDGISLLRLVSELGELITAASTNRPANLMPLHYGYGHYLNDQEKLPDTCQYQESEQYWLKQLHHVSGVLDLPYDQPRQDAPSYLGATCLAKCGGFRRGRVA